MAGEWTEESLATLCSYLNRGKAPAYTEKSGILVLNQKCVRDQRINFKLGRRTDSDRRAVKTERLLRPFDILVNSTGVGTLGRVAQVRKLPEPATIDGHITILRPDSAVIEPLYLGMAVRCYEAEIEWLGEGSTGQTELSRTRLGEFSVPVPKSRDEQRAIAHILGTLDDKIELNRQMNETLEAMARALFKSWFVDFDPVRAKMEGRWKKGQSLPGLPAHLYDLFPDRLVDSELGEIPEGWEVGIVGDLAEVSSGKRPIGRFPVPSESATVPLWGGNGPMAFVPKPLLDEPILLTGRVGTLGSVFRITTPCWPSDNTLVLRANQPSTFEYLFLQLQQIDFASLNRGSTQPLLTQTDLKAQPLPLPLPEVLEHFSSFVGNLYRLIDESIVESKILAALRDTLLPKLISGELRVKKRG